MSEFLYMTAPGQVGTSKDAGHWDGNGVPDYLEPQLDDVDASLLERLNRAFPEYNPVPEAHPEYLDKSIRKNLLLSERANVWVTFVDEGAGYKNAFGFYTYRFDPNDEKTFAPESFDVIRDTRVIALPNCSKPRKGGNLRSGSKVHLGTFEANTAVGFFLVPNGYNSSTRTIRSGVQCVYSDHQFNTSAEYVQTVLLKDEMDGRLAIGFEDIMQPAGDKDFNDCLLYFTVDPIRAVDERNLLQLPTATPVVDCAISADRSGLHVDMPQSVIDEFKQSNRSGDYYRVVHTMKANDKDHADLLENLWSLIVLEGTPIDESNAALGSTSGTPDKESAFRGRVLREDLQISVQYLIEHDLIRQFTYLMRVNNNLDDSAIVDEFHGWTVFDVMERLEGFYVQESLDQSVTIQRDVLGATDMLQCNKSVTTYLQQPKIWGDPHVRAMDGKVYTMPDCDDMTVYCLFADDRYGLEVRAEMWHHPRYKDISDPALKHVNDTTFIRRVSVRLEHAESGSSTPLLFDLDSPQLTHLNADVADESSGHARKLQLQCGPLDDDLCDGHRLAALRAEHGVNSHVRCVTLWRNDTDAQRTLLATIELVALPDVEFHLNEVNLRLPEEHASAPKPSWTSNGGRSMHGALVNGCFERRSTL